jgi:hypothetical protein
MDFIDQVKQFSKRALSVKENLQTEEATKNALVMPFFSMLGYDVFNPEEFMPEFTADVGIKKGEKVDYAIMQDGNPVILIEAKWVNESLTQHDSQLFRYFGTTSAKFGILTNGLIYKFYTDLDTPNKMDLRPFLEVNILDVRETQVSELKKFHKSNFNLEEVLNAASELRYSNAFRSFFMEQLSNPSDDMLKLFLSDTYSGRATQSVLDKFRPILKKALNQYISELMSDKIKNALSASEETKETAQGAPGAAVTDVEAETPENTPKVMTTEEELQAFAIIRGLLKDVVPIDDITYKDTISYFGVLYKDNTRKWICRLRVSDSKVVLSYPSSDRKTEIKDILSNIYDLTSYKDTLTEIVRNLV